MESGITIELEQSFASVVRYIQNKADNNAALYFDDLPEALEFINKNDTLGTYERMKKSGYLRKRLIV